jgi:hypothetical protein
MRAASLTVAAAIDTLLAPTWVLLRTSFATAKERWNSLCSTVPSVPAACASRTASFIWPRICGSPSTIESSPEATRNAWRTACSRVSVYMYGVMSSGFSLWYCASQSVAAPGCSAARYSSVRLQVDRIAASDARLRRSSPSASRTRSRMSSGAVWWFSPSAYSAMSPQKCAKARDYKADSKAGRAVWRLRQVKFPPAAPPSSPGPPGSDRRRWHPACCWP